MPDPIILASSALTVPHTGDQMPLHLWMDGTSIGLGDLGPPDHSLFVFVDPNSRMKEPRISVEALGDN